jgi:hypothetical protein
MLDIAFIRLHVTTYARNLATRSSLRSCDPVLDVPIGYPTPLYKIDKKVNYSTSTVHVFALCNLLVYISAMLCNCWNICSQCLDNLKTKSLWMLNKVITCNMEAYLGLPWYMSLTIWVAWSCKDPFIHCHLWVINCTRLQAYMVGVIQHSVRLLSVIYIYASTVCVWFLPKYW